MDEDELKEVPPAYLEGFVFSNAYGKRAANGNWVSSTYEVAWVFFSSSQIYIYRNIFNLDDGFKSETTDEFFYKDVTSLSTATETIQVKNRDKKGQPITIEDRIMQLVVPGDKMKIAMGAVPDAESIIQAMKQKLREKKSS